MLLERLVQNLVENGGAAQRRRTAAGCGSHRHPGTARSSLEVSNTGPVVPRYEVPGLFEPFRRLRHATGSPARGVGLGLSIVRAVARAHGGEVQAEPRDDGGLTVTVTLPGADPM